VIFDIVTLFPAMFLGPLEDGVLARARRAGRLALRIHDLRRFGEGRHRQVDDAPFGGGGGMVLMPGPFFRAVEAIRQRHPCARERVVLLSPQGPPLDHAAARRLAGYDRVILLAGRYEGVDERVRTALADEELSLCDVVVTGGELPALVVVDAVARFVPGVLGGAESAQRDSFEGGLLDHPHYTRPARFRDLEVPDVLRSGDHEAIGRWRDMQARRATREKRPDLPTPASPERIAPSGRARG
jgi:tRNA (guanine37-N1)-methyltransferase